jgi:ribosomal protein L21E
MSARAVFERACLAYSNLFLNVQTMVRFVIRHPFKDPQLTYFAQIMARNWDFAVKTHWRSFMINLASLTSQLVMYGLSPALFPDERDPRWRVIELNKFLVPNRAQSDLDLLTTVMVESEFTVQQLWGFYKQFKDKPDSPWNCEVLGNLLTQWSLTILKDVAAPLDMLDLEKRMLSGDANLNRAYSDSIKIISELQVEYSGKVSHYMFHRYYDGASASVIGTDGYLFFQKDQYQSISEALVIFTMNPGEYTLHENRGLGHKIYSLAQAKIQLDCAVVDSAKIASTIFIKSPNINTKDMEQIRWNPGAPTNLGSAELVENNIGANIQGAIGAAQYIGSLIQFNMTYSGQDPSQPDASNGSISPTQARLQAYREFAVLKNYISHFQNNLDYLFQNMTAKMLRSKEGYPHYEMAETWIQRSIEDGVPKQIFEIRGSEAKGWMMPSHLECYAVRLAGAGSQVAMLMGLQEIKEIISSFGTKGQKTFQRDFVTATLGSEAIDAYIDSDAEANAQTGGVSEAALENAIMQKLNMAAVFSPDNDQKAHIDSHMQAISTMIQAIVQGQMSPIDAEPPFDLMVPHLTQHIQYEQHNIFAEAYIKQIMPNFNQIVKYTNLNKKRAAQMLEAQQRQQQQDQTQTQNVMSDAQRKDFVAQSDERRKDFSLQQQNQRQEDQHQTKKAMLIDKTSSEIANETAKVNSEIVLKQKKNLIPSPGGLQPPAPLESSGSTSPAEQLLSTFSSETPAPFDIESPRPVVSPFDSKNNPGNDFG